MRNITKLVLMLAAGATAIFYFTATSALQGSVITKTQAEAAIASPPPPHIDFDPSKTIFKVGLNAAKDKQYIGYLLHFSGTNTIGSVDSFNTGQNFSSQFVAAGQYSIFPIDGETGAQNVTVKIHSYELTLSHISTSFGIVTGTDQSGKTQTFNTTDIFSITPSSNGGIPTVVFGVVNLESTS